MRGRFVKNSGCGIVVVRKFSNSWKILGLKDGGEYDLTKGHREKNETALECAIRETEEESGIRFNDLNFQFGDITFSVPNVLFFIASTTCNPVIRPNPETGIIEHDSADWLSFEEMEALCFPYLKPAVLWAKGIIEK